MKSNTIKDAATLMKDSVSTLKIDSDEYKNLQDVEKYVVILHHLKESLTPETKLIRCIIDTVSINFHTFIY